MEEVKVTRPVGKTALIVAACRASETRKDASVRLFNDPYASILAGKEGDEIFQLACTILPNIQEGIAVRTKHIDDLMEEWVLHGNIKQVVILGAGMDTRALRLGFGADVTVFELDFADVLQYKTTLLERCDIVPSSKGKRVCVTMDVRDLDWRKTLIEKGFKSDQSSAWILEGLLMYLPEKDVHAVLSHVSQMASPGSKIVINVLEKLLPKMTDHPNLTSYTKVMKDLSTDIAILWATETGEDLLKSYGFGSTKKFTTQELLVQFGFGNSVDATRSSFINGTKLI